MQQSVAESHRLRDEVLSLKTKLADAEELGLRLVGARRRDRERREMRRGRRKREGSCKYPPSLQKKRNFLMCTILVVSSQL